MRFAGWKLDLGSRSLWSPDGETVDLTGGTFDLLVVFAENPGRVLSRAALLDLVRHDEEVFDRAIDMRVRRLRTRIETDPRRPALIKTVRGVGYMFTAQVESD